MTDRELLELAAKAIGCAGAKFEDGEWLELRYGYKIAMWHDDLDDYWNPLESNADAFALAVKLNLHIGIDCESAGVVCVEWDFDQGGFALQSVEENAPVGGDDYAATRRAITRAAAEIGRRMP